MSGMYVNASLSLIGLCALTGAGVAIGSGKSVPFTVRLTAGRVRGCFLERDDTSAWLLKPVLFKRLPQL